MQSFCCTLQASVCKWVGLFGVRFMSVFQSLFTFSRRVGFQTIIFLQVSLKAFYSLRKIYVIHANPVWKQSCSPFLQKTGLALTSVQRRLLRILKSSFVLPQNFWMPVDSECPQGVRFYPGHDFVCVGRTIKFVHVMFINLEIITTHEACPEVCLCDTCLALCHG